MALERVQKIMAQAGLCSRRQAEDWILEGVVTINGKMAKLGDKADLGQDAIKVRGKLLQAKAEKAYYAFYKPKNVISALEDPQGRPAMGPYFRNIRGKVFPIGRLDFTSEGLLLFTNDGELAEKIQKSDRILKVYDVKVRGEPNAEMVDRLKHTGKVGYHYLKPHTVKMVEKFSSKSRIQIAIEGSNPADLKEFVETKGFKVDRMVRVAIGQISLTGMQPGEIRELRASQLEALLLQPELGLRSLEEEYTARGTTTEEEKPEKSGLKIVRSATASSAPRAPRRERSEETERPRRSSPRAPRSKDFGDRERRPPRAFSGGDRPRRPFSRDTDSSERRERRPARSAGPRARTGDSAAGGEKRFSKFKSDRPKRPFSQDRAPREGASRDRGERRPQRAAGRARREDAGSRENTGFGVQRRSAPRSKLGPAGPRGPKKPSGFKLKMKLTR